MPRSVWLASHECNINGQQIVVWGGRVARVVLGSGLGYFDRQLTAESVAEHWDEVMSADGLYEALDGIDDAQYWQQEFSRLTS